VLGVMGENLVGLERLKNCFERKSGIETHAEVEVGRVLLWLVFCWAVKRPMKKDKAEMMAAPMSVPMIAPALTPGLRDSTAAPRTPVHGVVLFVPAVVHVVRGVALKTAALEESGTGPRAAKPG